MNPSWPRLFIFNRSSIPEKKNPASLQKKIEHVFVRMELALASQKCGSCALLNKIHSFQVFCQELSDIKIFNLFNLNLSL